ncbi:MAG TPA: SDR family oxidoreductase [Gemmatimonadaceae bacterium]|nr:SDR family oxidoreductase [Gemmatimonadaceae bacterium]
MILVAGGTGRLGTLLVQHLTVRGLPVRVLTRDAARASHLARTGITLDVALGDVRNPDSLARAVQGADLVVSAMHGFSGLDDGSPASVDRKGNMNLIDAARAAGAAVVLMSVVGAAPSHAMELFRAKYDAERYLRQSGLRWTIVRATSFIETWAMVMGTPLQQTGKAMVLGRGENPINFVSTVDVAALLERAVIDPALRAQTIEIGGSANVTFNQFAATLLKACGRPGSVRHIPRPMLRAMGFLMRGLKPGFARHARAAVAMDTIDMTFDASKTRRDFPHLPNTDLNTAVERWFSEERKRAAPPAQK